MAEDHMDIILNQYLGAAFAQTEHLIKFEGQPDISFYCEDQNCQKVVKAVNLSITKSVSTAFTATEESNSKIAILFKLHSTDSFKSSRVILSDSTLKIIQDTDPRCFMTSIVDGFKVRKVIIEVAEDEGTKANIFCVVSKLLHGSGVSVSETYGDVVGRISALSNDDFYTVLSGLSVFLALHWSKLTFPGQDRNSTNEIMKNAAAVH